MLKKIVILIFTSLLFTFISCPHDCTPEEYKVMGKYIENLPDWTKDTLVSDWKPWNTEATEEFKKLFKQKESLNSGENSENINYRLFVTGQNLVLFFDDEERTACNPLWIWVSEYETGNDDIFIPQEKDNEFVFTGHAKSNHFESNTEQNKAYVKIELLNNKTYECNYLLKVNDVEIINERMTAKFSKYSEISYKTLMETFNYIDKEKKYGYESFSTPYCIQFFGNDDDRFGNGYFLYFEGLSTKSTYDPTSKTLTYELLGGTENMCHYMDIRFKSKDEINCVFYDWVDGEKKERYTEPLD